MRRMLASHHAEPGSLRRWRRSSWSGRAFIVENQQRALDHELVVGEVCADLGELREGRQRVGQVLDLRVGRGSPRRRRGPMFPATTARRTSRDRRMERSPAAGSIGRSRTGRARLSPGSIWRGSCSGSEEAGMVEAAPSSGLAPSLLLGSLGLGSRPRLVPDLMSATLSEPAFALAAWSIAPRSRRRPRADSLAAARLASRTLIRSAILVGASTASASPPACRRPWPRSRPAAPGGIRPCSSSGSNSPLHRLDELAAPSASRPA